MDVAAEGPVFAELQPFNNFNSIQQLCELSEGFILEDSLQYRRRVAFLVKKAMGFQ
jgi:hypothetical protein